MIRICVICEGPTEVDFVNRCLEPYLRPSGVSVYGTVLSARSGRHRGGRVTVDRLAHKISLHYGEADRVSTMLRGDEVEPRRDYIETIALRAANLDV